MNAVAEQYDPVAVAVGGEVFEGYILAPEGEGLYKARLHSCSTGEPVIALVRKEHGAWGLASKEARCNV